MSDGDHFGAAGDKHFYAGRPVSSSVERIAELEADAHACELENNSLRSRLMAAEQETIPKLEAKVERLAQRQHLLRDAELKAEWARERFGRHPSAEFAICRLTEEVGELAQAATATSKGRAINRRERIYDEAVDVIAMAIRLVDEFPEGMA